jgi:hypothetical protein
VGPVELELHKCYIDDLLFKANFEEGDNIADVTVRRTILIQVGLAESTIDGLGKPDNVCS